MIAVSIEPVSVVVVPVLVSPVSVVVVLVVVVPVVVVPVVVVPVSVAPVSVVVVPVSVVVLVFPQQSAVVVELVCALATVGALQSTQITVKNRINIVNPPTLSPLYRKQRTYALQKTRCARLLERRDPYPRTPRAPLPIFESALRSASI